MPFILFARQLQWQLRLSQAPNPTDAAVVALAEKCPGITHANFGNCGNPMVATVVAFASKCPGITPTLVTAAVLHTAENDSVKKKSYSGQTN